MSTTTTCPDGCGATISTALVTNRRRQSEAYSLPAKEQVKALARINGEILLCPKRGRR